MGTTVKGGVCPSRDLSMPTNQIFGRSHLEMLDWRRYVFESISKTETCTAPGDSDPQRFGVASALAKQCALLDVRVSEA